MKRERTSTNKQLQLTSVLFIVFLLPAHVDIDLAAFLFLVD